MTAQAEREPRWATLAEAEAYSRVPQRTLRRWIAAGMLPAVRVGPRRIEVNLNDVDKLRTPITPTTTKETTHAPGPRQGR